MTVNSGTGRANPLRGQVWSSDQVWSNGPADFVIISCDDWNGRRVNKVLGLEIEAGHQSDAGRFAPLIMANGQPMTVYGDMIMPIPKDGLSFRRIQLDATARG